MRRRVVLLRRVLRRIGRFKGDMVWVWWLVACCLPCVFKLVKLNQHVSKAKRRRKGSFIVEEIPLTSN